MAKPVILDAWGRPMDRVSLTQEVAAPRMGTARSPSPGYPGDGLNPVRLANLLRAADLGQPKQFLELAEQIEERDPHYLGVLGTRRRSVAQLDITVEAGSDDPEDERIAQMVRDYVERDELSEDIYHILDCLGKGFSGTEVVYEASEGQYLPRLIPRDPRIFRFDRNDLETPMVLNTFGQPEPLQPGHWIWATMKAKSGLAVRSGLARVAAWGWMFKAYTLRDWAIFTQTYGQPIRLGKYQPGAPEEDKATLYNAVAGIAGDCAAIISENMSIEFVAAPNVGAAHQLYKERADWIDQQISKAVLGQTSTTDAVVGGLGSGKEHREVQKDIEASDAKALAGILNRDLIRVWVQMEYGPRKRYPRLRIGRPEEEDLKALSEAIAPLIDRGLEVDAGDLRQRFGLPEPKAGAKLLRPQAGGSTAPGPSRSSSSFERFSGEFERVQPTGQTSTAPQAEGPSVAKSGAEADLAALSDQLAGEAAPAVGAMLSKIEAMLDGAASLEEFRQMLHEGFDDVDASALAKVLALAMTGANLAGRVAIEEEGA